ncbi:hypothetical protein [Streptomyces sp. NPDC057301]|uniref:hypothetical protein n=1 Tax=Streptomyces sp. NPDC057301 TaxID=3346093 RepID=UPI0036369A55
MSLSPNEERMRNLLVDRSSTAVTLAIHFSRLADPVSASANSPQYWPRIRSTLKYLEAVNCAVFRQGGMSWDALASFYGVSKQSVHRRLSPDVDAAVENSQKYVELHEHQLRRDIPTLVDAADVEAETLLLDAGHQAKVWSQRRRTPMWWWDEGVV